MKQSPSPGVVGKVYSSSSGLIIISNLTEVKTHAHANEDLVMIWGVLRILWPICMHAHAHAALDL